MLVLTRKVGEGLLIDGTYVKVLGLRPGRVTLGIEAPSEITVLREELLTRKSTPQDGSFAESK